MYRLHCLTALSAIIAGASGITGAQATVRVGGAADIVRSVSGSLPGQTYKKAKGDDIYENELISTKAESTARIVFVDKTHIDLGPTTNMKIDRVVFNPNQSVRALTVSAGAGAMRWISGESTSSAYQIKTPTAAIKVEGTTFDLIVESKRTTVVLQNGKVEVCSVGAPQQCKTLSEPGDIIVATPSGLEGPRRGGPGLSDFAALCLSVASQNCGLTTGRVNPPQQPPPSPRKDRAESSPQPGKYKLESADVPSKPYPGPKVVVVAPAPSTPPPETTYTPRHLHVISKVMAGPNKPVHLSSTSKGAEYPPTRTPRHPPQATPRPAPAATPRPAPNNGGMDLSKKWSDRLTGSRMSGALRAIRSAIGPRSSSSLH